MKKRWFLALVLALIAMIALPVLAAEGETQGPPHEEMEEESSGNKGGNPSDQGMKIYYFPEEGPDNDELFAGYVDQVFYGSGDEQNDTAVPRADGSAYPTYTGAKKLAADKILSFAKKMASGKQSSATLTITLEEVGETGKYYTAKDLGLSSITSNGWLSDAAYDAVMERVLSADNLFDIVHVQMAQYPYEYYWYDKTYGMGISGWPSISLTTYNGQPAAYVSGGTYDLSFYVCAAYSKTGNERTTVADTAKTGAATKAATNAKKIVTTYATYGDLEKLTAYKDKICTLVEYNYDALNGYVPYGDPWQLIWVFDNDSSTNVVCEGYAKAFQYLCDLSTFTSSKITVCTVTGYMDGGGHMWNIVKMEDGRNYIVDVTNVDAGSIGSDGSLFIGEPASRSGLDTYVFSCYNGYFDVTYKYDPEMLDMFDPKGILLLSEKAYGVSWSKPTISTQPSNQAAALGESVTFKVVAKRALFYQWEYSKDGGKTWVTWEGKTKASLTVKGSNTNNGAQYRCVIINSAGKVTSQAATLTVGETKPVITSQPADKAVVLGTSVTFKVVAANAQTYQWQYKKVGESWKKWTGRTSASVTVTASATNGGCQYRCVVTNEYGSVTSTAATLTVYTTPVITVQPETESVKLGDSVTFFVGTDNGTTFQWEYSKDNGATWVTWTSKKTASLTVTGSTTNNGALYRCVVSNPAGSVRSEAAKLYVYSGPIIYNQPEDQVVPANSYVYLNVGCYDATSYQWQVSKDNGATWKNISSYTYPSAKTSSFSFLAKTSMDQYLYRCVVKDSTGTSTSEPARLTVYEDVEIVQNPANVVTTAGTTVSFSVVTTGQVSSYQWQVSKDGGITWKNIAVSTYPSAATATLTFTAKANLNGYLYQCVITSYSSTTYSTMASLTVN